MAQGAIGFIETRGLVGAVEAADAAAKASSIDLLAFEQIGGGLVSVRFRGDVAAVQVAVQAGVEAAKRLGEVISHNVIPAPHADLLATLVAPPTAPRTTRPEPTTPTAPADAPARPERLDDVPVARLRQLVRQLPDAQLKGRQVSRANKKALIAELERAQRESR